MKIKSIKINDEKIDAYYSEGNKDYVLVYGMNMSSGITTWYQYDIKENTFQRYNDVGLSELQEKNFIYFIIMCVVGGVLVLSLLVMIILGINNSKLKKKNKKMLMMLEELNNRVKSGSIETKSEDKKIRKSKVIKKEN